MKTANILLIIFAFVAIGIYTKYIKAMINYRMGRTHQTVIIPSHQTSHQGFSSGQNP